ncbi:hypothetical protein EJ06DRAFT_73430 [Trichodelitschia bisporula]|uniref:N-acetyltransferase domain-containing protein n=1 Tax=Trichodelitschia bisporula TaxID=703511 RepID=A0A6G1HSW2_9PEZI|nr:hypothetical protein EJ06DRAFT_73430 [Trichodelitschia bisporula]
MALPGQNTPLCRLVPINMRDDDEFEELQRQRLRCGYASDDATLNDWRKATEAGTKVIFWICCASQAEGDGTRGDIVGHIALNSQTDPPDPRLAKADKSVLYMSTFFVFQERQRQGIGRAALSLLEEEAVREPYGSPMCKAITADTLSKKYTDWDGPQWRGLWPRLGLPKPPKGTSTEIWYNKLGWETWADEPKLNLELGDGSKVMVNLALLKRRLQ